MRSLLLGIFLCAAMLLPAAQKPEKDPPNDGHWWQRQYGSFVILSDVPAKGTYTGFIRRLENARSVFLLYLPELKKAAAQKGTVRIFRNREDYVACVGKEFEWSVGLWNGKEMVISPSPEKISPKEQKKRIREIVYHEGFHCFLDTSLGTGDAAGLWFHEGCAQFFEDQDNKGKIRPADALLARLAKTAQESQSPLKDLMMMEAEEFQQEKGRAGNYLLSHALIFYLLKGAPAEKSPFAAFPGEYLKLLMQKKKNPEALETLFKKQDPEKLETEFRAFWNSPSRIRRAVKYHPKEKK